MESIVLHESGEGWRPIGERAVMDSQSTDWRFKIPVCVGVCV